MALVPGGFSCQNVHYTGSSTITTSRQEILRWVNNTAETSYVKIEALCDGVAYCRLIDILFPGSVNLKSVKTNAKYELDYMHNLKLLQLSLNKVNSNKTVPMELLCKGRFQHNLEFLQWFKKFFDVNNVQNGMPNNSGEESTLNFSISSLVEKPSSTTGPDIQRLPGISGHNRPFSPSAPGQNSPISPSALGHNSPSSRSTPGSVFMSSFESKKLEQLTIAERNFYYEKLRSIEIICQTHQGSVEDHNLSNRILQVLWEH